MSRQIGHTKLTNIVVSRSDQFGIVENTTEDLRRNSGLRFRLNRIFRLSRFVFTSTRLSRLFSFFTTRLFCTRIRFRSCDLSTRKYSIIESYSSSQDLSLSRSVINIIFEDKNILGEVLIHRICSKHECRISYIGINDLYIILEVLDSNIGITRSN